MLYAVIMAGGRGKRFWPKSRMKRPKQVLKIADENKSMIELTVSRIKDLVSKENIRIVTNYQQANLIKSQLPDFVEENFIIEPAMKNTAPCIGLSAVLLKNSDPEATMLVLPADHIVKDKELFLDTVKTAQEVAEDKDALVTFGIKPTFASTGYGYIQVVQSSRFKVEGKDVFKVERFTEKPDKSKAKEFIKSGKFFWNSGMFVWKVSTILKGFRLFMPKLYNSLLEIEKFVEDTNFEPKLSQIYKTLEDKSIDYGVMEPATSKAKSKDSPEVYSICSNFGWNDVGSWRSLDEILEKDNDGNIKLGKNVSLDVEDSIIVTNSEHLVGAIDVKDIILVHTKDATLVCHKKSAQKVKKLLKVMEQENLQDYL